MPTYRFQTSIQDVSGLPRDQYVNTLHWSTPNAPDDTAFVIVTDKVIEFYNTLSTWFSAGVAGGGHTLKVYLVGAPLGSPAVYTRTFGLGFRGAGKPLPNEVACCLTFHANPVPNVPRQSWRGRIYVGPLDVACLGATGVTGGRPDGAFRTALLNAGKTMLEGLDDISGGSPVIYSRTRNAIYPIANCSVDDAWDTQRSRGLRPSVVTKVDLVGIADGPGVP